MWFSQHWMEAACTQDVILGTFVDEVIHLATRQASEGLARRERKAKERGGGKGRGGVRRGVGFQMSNGAHIISHFGGLFVCTGEVPSTVCATGPSCTDETLLHFFWSSSWPPSQLCEQGGGVTRPWAVHERMTHDVLAPVMTQTRWMVLSVTGTIKQPWKVTSLVEQRRSLSQGANVSCSNS